MDTEEKAEKVIQIYTDGACKGNPGPGGYGVVLIYEKLRKELAAGYRKTTNNRMELMAAIVALSALRFPCSVRLHSDSQYVINGFEKKWVNSWKRSGWVNSQKQPVKNKDLWIELDRLVHIHKTKFIWVRGHASNKENNRCDEIAVKASHGKDLKIDEGFEDGQRFGY